MAEISRDKQLEWGCRILITLDLYFVAAGYILYFQTNYQLVSPLIPRSTLYDITDTIMKASLIATVGLLGGLWFYFFGKKLVAFILFSLTAIIYELSPNLF